jgi:valine dehydrogenase (NAD+)
VSVFERTDHLRDAGHEQVVFCQDRASGLRAIIAIYSTALGPALGGTRFYPYADEAAALTDVLNLARGMAYKAACAGLDLGGGKGVIIGDPDRIKTEVLLRAYGRFVQAMGGRFYTACDVGTTMQDMDVIARESRFVTGRSREHGGAGDTGIPTAYGVFQSMRAAAEQAWGSDSFSGRRVGVEGVGQVGRHLVKLLVEAGADVVVSDVNPAATAAIVSAYPGVQALGVEELPRAELDVYSPCALGGSLSDEVVPALTASVVCGGANNQLAHPGIEAQLAGRGIVYVPDYVANSGGMIHVADEIEGFSLERANARVARLYDSTRAILAAAAADGVPAAIAADRLAEQRMAEVGRLRSILLPPAGRPHRRA